MSQTPIFPPAAAKLAGQRDRQIAEAAWRAGVEAAAKTARKVWLNADAHVPQGAVLNAIEAAIRALQPPPDLGDAP
jgi:hypothetical protein